MPTVGGAQQGRSGPDKPAALVDERQLFRALGGVDAHQVGVDDAPGLAAVHRVMYLDVIPGSFVGRVIQSDPPLVRLDEACRDEALAGARCRAELALA